LPVFLLKKRKKLSQRFFNFIFGRNVFLAYFPLSHSKPNEEVFSTGESREPAAAAKTTHEKFKRVFSFFSSQKS